MGFRNRFREIAVCACAISLLIGTAPAALAARTPAGSAEAQNTLFAASIGGLSVRLGVDTVSSNWGTTRNASAEMLLGQAAGITVTGAKKVSSSASDGGTAVIAKRTVAVGSLAGLSVASGSVGAFVEPDHVASSADLSAGSFDALGGIASLATAGVHTITRVEKTEATVTRRVALGATDLLSIGDLLGAVGVDPLALACDAVGDAGAALGIPTENACQELDAATTAIGGARTELDSLQSAAASLVEGFTLSDVQADDATISGLTCGASDVVCQAAALAQLVSLNNAGGYGVDLTGLGLDDAKSAMLARIDEIEQDFANLDALTAAIATAASGACTDVADALSAVAEAVPDSASTLDPLRDGVVATCNALAATLSSLLDVPLLSLGTADVTLDTSASARKSGASVTGTLANLKVGNLSPVGQALSLSQSGLGGKIAIVRDHIAQALQNLGIGLGVPELDLMKTTTLEGTRADGTRYASASLTAVHFRVPPATLQLPDSNPLGMLAGTTGFPAAHSSPRVSSPRISAVTPDVSLDVARFTGQSAFRAGGDGRTLALTGIADGPEGIVLAVLLFCGAGAVRRFLLAR